MQDIQNIVKLFFEAGALKRMHRSHNTSLILSDHSDTIAAHSYRVCLIAYMYALEFLNMYMYEDCEYDVDNLSIEEVLIMALFHDFSETRSGDQNWIQKRYVVSNESQIIKDQFEYVDSQTYHLLEEYNKRESIESKLVKDADLLEQLVTEKEYAAIGNTISEKWIKQFDISLFNFPELAYKFYIKIVQSDVDDWANGLATPKRLTKEEL